MASEKTVYSNDQNWKIKIEAYKNYFFFYSDIGTKVKVYHKQKTTDTWGKTKTDWVKKAADSIYIKNIYSGDSPKLTLTKEKTCQNAKTCGLYEWAVGIILFKVTASGDLSAGPQTADLIVKKVTGQVSVRIGTETLTGEVSASSPIQDSQIW